MTMLIAVSASATVGTSSAPIAAYLISRASIFLPRYSGVRPDHQTGHEDRDDDVEEHAVEA